VATKRPSESGAASVEHAGLTLLIALLVAGLVAAFSGDPPRASRELGEMLARRIACPARLPQPCRRDPLLEAYGRPLAALVRRLSPSIQGRPGPAGFVTVPVDFRYCRRESCAVPGAGPLTTANRRVTAFTEVRDRRRAGEGVRVVYWLYRPGIGWDAAIRTVVRVPVPRGRIPSRSSEMTRLVPLETLAGRNHYRFPAGERPPWQWRVASR
jgi:hypothetical protein